MRLTYLEIIAVIGDFVAFTRKVKRKQGRIDVFYKK